MNYLSELKLGAELLSEAIETVEKRRAKFIYEGQIKEQYFGEYEEITYWNTQLTKMENHLKMIEEQIMKRIEYIADPENYHETRLKRKILKTKNNEKI